MPKRFLVLIFVVLMLLVAAVVFGPSLLPKDLVVVNINGAEPTMTNPAYVKRLAELGFQPNVQTNSDLLNLESYPNTDIIFGGSLSFVDEFDAKYKDPKGPRYQVKPPTTFQSPLLPFVKGADLDAFVQSGLFTKNGNHTEISGKNMYKIVYAMVTPKEVKQPDGTIVKVSQTWRDLGVNLPGTVLIGTADPLLSSGGRYALAYFASCLASKDCSKTVTDQEIATYLPQVVKAWEDNGKKSGDQNSLQVFLDWANASQSSTRIMMAYESAAMSWWSGFDDAKKQSAKVHIVGTYPEFTFMSSQVALPLNKKGLDFLKAIQEDAQLAKIANGTLGMRVGFGASLTTDDAPWVDTTNSSAIIVDPKTTINTAITNGIRCRLGQDPAKYCK